MIEITTLMDNVISENKALTAEHGLSFLVEKDGCRMLFDCGASEMPWKNARRMGKSVVGLDAVILSHSHYDHAAGYRDLISIGGGSRILYTGPHFFEKKYAFDGMCYTDLSAGFTEAFLNRNGICRKICYDVLEAAEGIWLIGGFPRIHDFEQIPERFVRRRESNGKTEMIPDDFSDEICMALDTPKGLVVLTGCSHPGILNMIQHVYKVLKRPVFGVFGGTHLAEADEARIQETIRNLKEMGLSVLGLSHCSGELAERAVKADAGVKGCHMAVGDTILL